MAQTNGELSQDLDVLRNDMGKLRADMGEMLAHLTSVAGEKAGAVGGKAKEAGKRAVHYTEETIRERPLTSVFVLFFVGLLMGLLLDRKIAR